MVTWLTVNVLIPVYLRQGRAQQESLHSKGLPQLTTSDGTARVPLIHYENATDWLESIKIIQDNALIVRVFVTSELGTCGTGREGVSGARSIVRAASLGPCDECVQKALVSGRLLIAVQICGTAAA